MLQTSGPQTAYTSHSDASAKAELNALVAVYRFVLRKRKIEGSSATAHDDRKEIGNAPARTKHSRR